MWSDELDKKIQDAARADEPALNEQAWDKMELLLDKHLPQEKKRRRFIFWILLPLLTAIPVYMLIQHSPGEKAISSASEQKNTPASGTINTPPGTESKAGKSAADYNSEPVNTGLGAGNENKTALSQPANDNSVSGKMKTDKTISSSFSQNEDIAITKGRKTKSTITIPLASQQNKSTEAKASNTSGKKKTENVSKKQNIDNPITSKDNFSDNNAITKSNEPNIATSSKQDQNTTKEELKADSKEEKEKTDQPETKPVVAQKKKPAGNPGSKFSLQFSFGPDVSSVDGGNPGQVTMQYGLGAAYAITKRLSVRSGFFVGRKKYDADSSDYHPDGNFWNYYRNMEKIEANCLVYEIPVTLVYNFPSGKKHSWFVSSGLSSYLMKKETYEYYYKNSAGQPQYRSRTTQNENSHLFSILDISGGYQYNLNNKLSLMAEPYTKIPLSGIGFGKVKLNSAGILFTVNYKPFLKNR